MKLKTFDSHCHPQFAQYDSDREEMIARALDAGIGMLCVGTDARTSEQAVGLAQKYDGIYASVGIHPNEPFDGAVPTGVNPDAEHEHDEVVLLRSIVSRGKESVVAIGEIGLDYYRSPEPSRKASQSVRFRQQLDFAIEMRLPVIVHSRESARQFSGASVFHDTMVDILRAQAMSWAATRSAQHAADVTDNRGSSGPGVLHSFTGTATHALDFLNMGYSIGLNAIVTFSDDYHEMVRSIPHDRLLLETDAPYLAPAPYRGKRNEPGYLVDIAAKIATIRSQPVEDLLECARQNFELLFLLGRPR
jgi:TatD DNase family protein